MSDQQAPMKEGTMEVGTIKASAPITIQRDPDGGSWEAKAEALNQAALGPTPRDAVENLQNALNKKGLRFQAHVDTKLLADLALR